MNARSRVIARVIAMVLLAGGALPPAAAGQDAPLPGRPPEPLPPQDGLTVAPDALRQLPPADVLFPPARRGRSSRALREVGAVVLTGVGHLAFSALGASAVFIPLASAGWGAYVVHRARTDPAFLERVGFTSDSLRAAFHDAGVAAAGSMAVMAGIGLAQGTLALHPDMVPLLVLYPAWGLVQQLLVQGFVAGHLDALPGVAGSRAVVTLASALLFGAVHLPNLLLTAGTVAIGLVFTPLYLKHRNLWPLGLFHGWLGVFYYFWVLDQNPWRSVVGP